MNSFNPSTIWEESFTKASELLYNATDGQVQLGTIDFYNNCPEVAATADIVIEKGSGGASAHAGGLGTNGRHLYLKSDTHWKDEPGNRGYVGIVHELGHYVFSLLDSYIDKDGNPASCIAGSSVASLMDAGTFVRSERTEFALEANEDDCADTAQVQVRGETDWPWIVDYVSDTYGATLIAPAAYNQAMPADHQALTFNYFSCDLRSVIALDRSGSMDGAKLSTAKAGAKLYVDLAEATDSLGVSSFSSSASVDYGIDEMTDPNKALAKAAIDGLSATGSTSIGGGLRTSLNMITGEGDKVSNEVIVLLSDGRQNAGENPASVLPDLKDRGVAVYAIGIGADVDAGLLSNIANETGGT